jgi:hypothetical protein
MKTQNRVVNILTTLVGMLVLGIGAGAFILSYDSLHAVAIEAGKPASKAWIFPLLVDGALITFTVTLLVFQILRADVRAWVGLVVLFTLATVGFNLAHSERTWLGWSVAVVAPLSLFLSTESVRHIAKTFIERSAHVATLAELASHQAAARTELERLTSQLEQYQGRLTELKSELTELRKEKKQATFTGISDETKRNALLIMAENADITGAELGRLLGKSDTTGRRLKAELLPVVAGGQNGNGHNGVGV